MLRADGEPAMLTSDISLSQIASRMANYELNIVLLGTCGGISSQNPSKEALACANKHRSRICQSNYHYPLLQLTHRSVLEP